MQLPWHEKLGKRQVKAPKIYFRATGLLHALMLRGTQRIGVEFKRADVPTVTRSMHAAIKDLKPDALYVVYPGEQRYTLLEGVPAVPLWALL